MAQQALGIAFDPPTLTLVQLTGTAKTFRVTFVHQLTLPHPTDPAEQVIQQRHAVQALVRTHRLRADTIVTMMPAHQAVLRTLEMPFQDPRRLRAILKYALEDHMPFAPEDVVVDFQRLALPTTSAARLLVAATPHQEIVAHLALFQAGGLEPTMVDLDVFALANAPWSAATSRTLTPCWWRCTPLGRSSPCCTRASRCLHAAWRRASLSIPRSPRRRLGSVNRCSRPSTRVNTP